MKIQNVKSLKMHANAYTKIEDLYIYNPIWEQELATLPGGAQPSRTKLNSSPFIGNKSSPHYPSDVWSSRTVIQHTQESAYTSEK